MNVITRLRSLALPGCCFLSLGTLGASAASWPGAEDGWVETNDQFLGWTWVDESGGHSWIYPANWGNWMYLPSSHVTDFGAWAYLINLAGVPLGTDWVASGWLYSDDLSTWIYMPGYTTDTAHGWAYVWNSGDPVAMAPDAIKLEASHTADREAEDFSVRYANALHIPAAEIEAISDYDSEITASTGPDGVTFTSTASQGQGNRMVRIGYAGGAGLFDLTALEGISGTAYVDVVVDVDLSATSNGFYVRLKRGDQDVAAFTRLDAGVVQEDMVVNAYLTNSEDGAYIEITLPWQGIVTVKDIYVHMEDVVTGFAGMRAKITGGEGATPENTHTVTNAAEFAAALDTVNAANAPSIIYVDGTITYDDWVAATGNDSREAQLGEGSSNVSIIGVGENALFDGVGFALQGSNYILQNLTVRYVLGRDAIQINNGRFVLIDHCTLYNESMEVNDDKDKFDELVSIKNNAHSVVLSWNHMYDSHKTILVGSNDEVEALPDRKLIMHHNWIHDCGSRLPLYRGGYAHIYNNLFETSSSAINVRTKSKILIENNYFNNVDGPIGFWFDSVNPAGLYEVNDNIYVNADPESAPTESTIDIVFESGYEYTLDPTAELLETVKAGAGQLD